MQQDRVRVRRTTDVRTQLSHHARTTILPRSRAHKLYFALEDAKRHALLNDATYSPPRATGNSGLSAAEVCTSQLRLKVPTLTSEWIKWQRAIPTKK